MKIGNKDIRLPKRFKDKWIKALRSGKYKQGESYLWKESSQGEGTYCCLGVACVISGVKEKDLAYIVIDDLIAKKSKTKIPDLLIEKNDGCFEDNRIMNKLIKMNDTNHWSFNRIANYIEKFL